MKNFTSQNYFFTFLVFIATVLLMVASEAILHFLVGNRSTVESQVISIFSIAFASAVIFFMLHKQYNGLNKKLIHLNEELTATQEDFSCIFNATPDPTIICDKHGTILMVSQQVEQLLGYSPKDLIGHPVEIVVPQRFKAKHPELVERYVTSPIFRSMGRGRKVHALRKDGSEIDVEISLSPITTSKGMLYSSSLRDTTERNRIERELRIAAAAFETHEAIMITDPDANIVRVNHAFENITGYSPEEVLGKNVRILKSGRHDLSFYIEMWQKISKVGIWKGEVWDKHKNGNIYPKELTITAVKDEQGTTTQYVAIFADISRRKQSEEEIQKLAFYDVLTNLPNRRLLIERLKLALAVSERNKQYGALLFLDLDKFKALNDTLGHDYGDMLLIEVATRLEKCLRKIDTAARLGGDEFVVIIENLSDEKEEAMRIVTEIAEKISQALLATYQLKDQTYQCSSSIGACLFLGHNESVNEMLKRADFAMYQAKKSGEKAIRFFEPSMQESHQSQSS